MVPITVYARNDHTKTAVSPEAHGGCGDVHERPLDGNGKPVKVWALVCPFCEQHLRHDPLWSSTISKIPETYDESAYREEREKVQAREQQEIMVQALAVLAGNVQQNEGPKAPCPNGHLNHATAKFCTECGAPVARADVRLCSRGHESPAAAKFCVECGQPLAVALPAAAEPPAPEGLPVSGNGNVFTGNTTQPSQPSFTNEDLVERGILPPPVTSEPQDTPQADVPGLPSNTVMRGMKREDLAALAEQAGLDASGNRAVLLDRLIAANNATRTA